MIDKIINQYLEKMAEEILNLNDEKIQNFLDQTEMEGAEYQHQLDFMKTILSQVLIEPAEHQQQALYDQMEQFVNLLHVHSDSYLFEVHLKDNEIHSTREFRIPAYLMVSDLAYAVMAAYGAIGSADFSVSYQQDRFALNNEGWESIPADMVTVAALEMNQNDELTMDYDSDENWEFVIRYKGKKKVEFERNVPELIGGEGYNIWEDGRDLLRKLVQNHEQVILIHEGKEVTVQECADAENITELKEQQMDEFVNDLLELKMMYEHLEEPDFSDEFEHEFYQA